MPGQSPNSRRPPVPPPPPSDYERWPAFTEDGPRRQVEARNPEERTPAIRSAPQPPPVHSPSPARDIEWRPRTVFGFWPLVAAGLVGGAVVGVSVYLVSLRQTVRPEVFENVYAAAKAIEGSLGVGVKRSDYHDLLRALATQVSIAGDKVSSRREKEVLTLYEDAISAYGDAETLWEMEEGTRRCGGELARWDRERLDSIAAKYAIPENVVTEAAQKTSIGCFMSGCYQPIWRHAAGQVEKARKLCQ